MTVPGEIILVIGTISHSIIIEYTAIVPLRYGLRYFIVIENTSKQLGERVTQKQ